jgi:hypothetical protein
MEPLQEITEEDIEFLKELENTLHREGYLVEAERIARLRERLEEVIGEIYK